MTALDEGTYRMVKNEDYERLLGLANLTKKAINEVVEEVIEELTGGYKNTIKQIEEKLESSRRINNKLYRLNDRILDSVIEELGYSDISRRVFKSLEQVNSDLRRGKL